MLRFDRKQQNSVKEFSVKQFFVQQFCEAIYPSIKNKIFKKENNQVYSE